MSLRDPHLLEVGRRALATPGWRWIRGMVDQHGNQVVVGGPHGIYMGPGYDGDRDPMRLPEDSVPDVSDPATKGCLLALVREVWATPTACVICTIPSDSWVEALGISPKGSPVWWVEADPYEGTVAPRQLSPLSASEGEALVASLEAALTLN